MKRIRILWCIVLNLLFFTFAAAAPVNSVSPDFETDILLRWRLSVMPVISFYNNNPDYTINTHALVGFGLGAKAELSLKSNKRSKLIAGMEYINQGLKFDSYYFMQGYSLRYDKHFDYEHSIRFQAIELPLLYKQCFTDEDDKFYSAYVMIGWACRYIFTANATITNAETGTLIWEGTSDLESEHPLFYKKISTALLFGGGFERKLGNYNHAVFFEACYHYNLFRLHYTGNELSNNIFFKNNQLTIGIGYKF